MTPLHPFEDWLLSAHLAGDASPREAARLTAHLAGCAECRARQAELARVGDELRALPALEPARDLWPAISARLSAARSAAPACAERLEEWRLSAYLDGDLDAAHRRAVDAHLAGCGACRSKLEDLRAVLTGLHGLPAAEPSPFLWARVQAGLERAHPATRTTRFEWARWIPAGAAVAAALAAVVWKGPLVASYLVPAQQQSRQLAAGAARPGTTAATSTQAASPANGATSAAPVAAGVFGEAGHSTASARADLPPSRSYTAAAREWIAGLSTSARTRSASQVRVASTSGALRISPEQTGPDADPTLSEAIRAHLEQLDANIRDTQTNLALNPGNERVQAAAWAAYTAKIEYLRSILGRNSGSQSRNRSTSLPAAGSQGIAA
jgi:predicted anti-sigma-YlaC factor YlaD